MLHKCMLLNGQPPKITLTFNGNGGSPSNQTVVARKGDKWSKIKGQVSTPSRTGYRFTGWTY